jgi:FtsP/CotA-like multicopper oxidase with cupredoxin domain
VLTSRDRQDVCLALPDPPAGFGSTCATLDTVTRHGLVAMLTAPAPSTTPSRIAVVIPDGVPAPEIQYRDGRRVRLPVVNGVATASISGRRNADGHSSGRLATGSGAAAGTGRRSVRGLR